MVVGSKHVTPILSGELESVSFHLATNAGPSIALGLPSGCKYVEVRVKSHDVGATPLSNISCISNLTVSMRGWKAQNK